LTLQRRTPLKRGAPLKRTAFKPKRKTSKFEFTPEAKAEMRARSHGACEAGTILCHGKATLFHHIKRRSQRGKGVASNGMHLCHWCHVWIHDHTGDSYERGWLIRSSSTRET
jgi:hypothetical protein